MEKVFIIKFPEVKDWPKPGDVYEAEYYTSYRGIKKGYSPVMQGLENAFGFELKEHAQESIDHFIKIFGDGYSDYEIVEIEREKIKRIWTKDKKQENK